MSVMSSFGEGALLASPSCKQCDPKGVSDNAALSDTPRRSDLRQSLSARNKNQCGVGGG